MRQVLDGRQASAELDYKEQFDLSQRRDKVEIAKDVAAMQARGDLIVVGSTDVGKLSEAMALAG